MNLDVSARVLLGLFFVFSGSIKVQQVGNALYPKLHKNMVREFQRYHRVSIVKEYLPEMKTKEFRELVGYIEMTCGFLMMTGYLTFMSSVFLMVLMGISIHSHVMLKDDWNVTIVPVLIGVALLLILVTKDSAKADESTETKKNK